MSEHDPRYYLQNSRVLADCRQVQEAITRMAAEINGHYGDRPIVLLVVMTGAMVPAVWLASRLQMPVLLDFLHVTRYDGATEGGEIAFRIPPRLDLAGQDVLVVEDIFDVGLTLQAVLGWCRDQGARSVRTAVLVRKLHDRETTGHRPEFIGLEMEDCYLFGCGMDVHEHWRHIDEIRALELPE